VDARSGPSRDPRISAVVLTGRGGHGGGTDAAIRGRAGSLAEQALGADGYGMAFSGLPADGAPVFKAAYFGIAAPLPILAAC
jgi:hypothetical protein